jgi:hypothetical protein
MKSFKNCGLVSLCLERGVCQKYNYLFAFKSKAKNLELAYEFEKACETAKSFQKSDLKNDSKTTDIVKQGNLFGENHSDTSETKDAPDLKDVPPSRQWRYILGAEI